MIHENGRENRNHGNEEESKEGCQEEEEITFLGLNKGGAQASPSLFGCSLAEGM
jgi:hypothetical protein